MHRFVGVLDKYGGAEEQLKCGARTSGQNMGRHSRFLSRLSPSVSTCIISSFASLLSFAPYCLSAWIRLAYVHCTVPVMEPLHRQLSGRADISSILLQRRPKSPTTSPTGRSTKLKASKNAMKAEIARLE